MYFLDKKHWPPNSPDLNPLDYYYWDAIVSRMKVDNVTNVEEFKAEICRAAVSVPIEDIKKAVLSFNRRVRKVEELKGGYPFK